MPSTESLTVRATTPQIPANFKRTCQIGRYAGEQEKVRKVVQQLANVTYPESYVEARGLFKLLQPCPQSEDRLQEGVDLRTAPRPRDRAVQLLLLPTPLASTEHSPSSSSSSSTTTTISAVFSTPTATSPLLPLFSLLLALYTTSYSTPTCSPNPTASSPFSCLSSHLPLWLPRSSSHHLLVNESLHGQCHRSQQQQQQRANACQHHADAQQREHLPNESSHQDPLHVVQPPGPQPILGDLVGGFEDSKREPHR
eukprot:758827-Hanusia_phi.AAC.6